MKIVRRGALPVGGDSGLDSVRDGSPWPATSDAGAARRGRAARRAAGLRRPRAGASSTLRHRAAEGRARRRQRHGRHMLAPILDRLPILAVRCFTSSPTAASRTTSRTRCWRRTGSSSSTRARARAPTSASPSTATATAASSSTTTGEFVPGRLHHGADRRADAGARPGATIIYDVRASPGRARARRAPGRPAVPSRVGHAYIKHRIRQEDALFAGEVSGHYYFRDFYGVDTGIVPRSRARARLARGGKLSELLAPLQRGPPPLRRDQLEGAGRAAEAAGAEGALRADRRRWTRLAPRRL